MEVIKRPIALHPFQESDECGGGGELFEDDPVTIRSIACRLEESLRVAKKEHLACGEVLLPPNFLLRIARDIHSMADKEPCGLRGALIILHFGGGSGAPHHLSRAPSDGSLNSNDSSGSSGTAAAAAAAAATTTAAAKEIGRIRCDPATVATFQLHLTLKEDPTPWYSRLPQILRSWTKGKTIVVSAGYTLAKKKLYRSH